MRALVLLDGCKWRVAGWNYGREGGIGARASPVGVETWSFSGRYKIAGVYSHTPEVSYVEKGRFWTVPEK